MQLLIKQAQASVKAGKGTQLNAQPHQNAAGAEAYLEAIGANASTASASAWTVAIGLAGQGVVGIGRFGLTFERGVGAYFSSSENGVYATLGGACFSGMQVGAAGACGIEITYLWSGGVEIFSGASWTISVQGGDIVGGAVNLIFATPSLVPSGFSVVFPFGEGGSISMQAAKTWTGATS